MNTFEIIKTVRLTEKATRQADSFNQYTGKWQQTWVDDAGDITEFVDGEYKDQVMRFRAETRSADGKSLVTASDDGTVRIWDTATATTRHALTGHTSVVYAVAIAPDGTWLATASDDGTTRLWNLNVQYAIQRICTTAGGLTPRQWNQYIPQLRYQPSCRD
jgi:WD40 repeat protein